MKIDKFLKSLRLRAMDTIFDMSRVCGRAKIRYDIDKTEKQEKQETQHTSRCHFFFGKSEEQGVQILVATEGLVVLYAKEFLLE